MMKLMPTSLAVFAFASSAVAHPAVHLHTHVFSAHNIFLLGVTCVLMAVAVYIFERSRPKRAVKSVFIIKPSEK